MKSIVSLLVVCCGLAFSSLSFADKFDMEGSGIPVSGTGQGTNAKQACNMAKLVTNSNAGSYCAMVGGQSGKYYQKARCLNYWTSYGQETSGFYSCEASCKTMECL